MAGGDDEPQGVVGQVDSLVVPRYAGFTTFARLPRIDDVEDHSVAVLGVPFDSGVTYRPGARFGPAYIRQASRLLRPYHQELAVAPFRTAQVVDAGDVAASPFSIDAALALIEHDVTRLTTGGRRVVVLGGDHTVALPVLRALAAQHGPLALLHFDAHLDTWDTYFDAPYTHGTPFRRAWEEGLLVKDRSAHVGIRGSVYDPADLEDDARFGFTIVHAQEFERRPVDEIGTRLVERVGDSPLYVSVDIDVLDPAHAPGTGTPEAGGLTSRELLALIRGLKGRNLVGADVVEVAPAYDHAEITAVAAANVAYEFLSLFALGRS
jgi:agmatinase